MSDSGAKLARQLAGFAQATGFLLGKLAGTKKRREALREYARLQAKVCTATWGPGSNGLVKLIEFMLAVPVEGDLSDREFEHLVQTTLQSGELPPEPLAPAAELDTLLQGIAAQPQARPAHQKTPRVRKKGGGKK
jgi:hypothetical protein